MSIRTAKKHLDPEKWFLVDLRKSEPRTFFDALPYDWYVVRRGNAPIVGQHAICHLGPRRFGLFYVEEKGNSADGVAPTLTKRAEFRALKPAIAALSLAS